MTNTTIAIFFDAKSVIFNDLQVSYDISISINPMWKNKSKIFE